MTFEGFAEVGYVNKFVELVLVAKLDRKSLILVRNHGRHIDLPIYAHFIILFSGRSTHDKMSASCDNLAIACPLFSNWCRPWHSSTKS